MKSAYELAMERLEKQSPTAKLTDAQKAEITEQESLFKAKKAEKELFLQGEIAKAEAKGDYEAIGQLQQQLARELRRLDEDLEEKKEKVRKARK
jgi:ribosome-associated translation inhibitor RaiA